MEKDWGHGIPKCSKDDLMTGHELLNFAMKIVYDYELKPNGYEIVASSDDIKQIPNFVVKKCNQLFFIIVKAAIAPSMPKLSTDEINRIKIHSRKFNAKCFFAPVGFGSVDAERFAAGLALRGDGYYSNYRGLEEST